MPATEIYLYRDDDGAVPFLQWLDELEERNRKVYLKVQGSVSLLAALGNELRRPVADYLRDGVYELRFKMLGVNYRVLYGFVGKDIVLISHGITKRAEIPASEIERAVKRLTKFRSDPEKYGVLEEGNG